MTDDGGRNEARAAGFPSPPRRRRGGEGSGVGGLGGAISPEAKSTARAIGPKRVYYRTHDGKLHWTRFTGIILGLSASARFRPIYRFYASRSNCRGLPWVSGGKSGSRRAKVPCQ